MTESELLFYVKCDVCGAYLKRPHSDYCSFRGGKEILEAMKKHGWTSLGLSQYCPICSKNKGIKGENLDDRTREV